MNKRKLLPSARYARRVRSVLSPVSVISTGDSRHILVVAAPLRFACQTFIDLEIGDIKSEISLINSFLSFI